MAFCLKFCGGKSSSREGGDKKKKKNTAWRVFSLEELHAATNNFNYDNKLGEGGFGSVYWGQLWDGSQFAMVTPMGTWFRLLTVCFGLGAALHVGQHSKSGKCGGNWNRKESKFK